MKWEDGSRFSNAQLIRFDAPVTATIAESGTKTGAIDNRASALCGVILPATFTGTTLTFEVCATEDGTFRALHDDDGAISRTVAQGLAYALPDELATFPWFKIVSGSTEGSERSLTVTRLR